MFRAKQGSINVHFEFSQQQRFPSGDQCVEDELAGVGGWFGGLAVCLSIPAGVLLAFPLALARK